MRSDERVTIMERTNARHLRLADLPGGQRVQMLTLDLSFISVLKVFPALCELMTHRAHVIVLVKPQFEAERHQVKAQCSACRP